MSNQEFQSFGSEATQDLTSRAVDDVLREEPHLCPYEVASELLDKVIAEQDPTEQYLSQMVFEQHSENISLLGG